jgi:hypothetical protein
MIGAHDPTPSGLAATRRRNLTMLCADLSDSTRIAATIDARGQAVATL